MCRSEGCRGLGRRGAKPLGTIGAQEPELHSQAWVLHRLEDQKMDIRYNFLYIFHFVHRSTAGAMIPEGYGTDSGDRSGRVSQNPSRILSQANE